MFYVSHSHRIGYNHDQHVRQVTLLSTKCNGLSTFGLTYPTYDWLLSTAYNRWSANLFDLHLRNHEGCPDVDCCKEKEVRSRPFDAVTLHETIVRWANDKEVGALDKHEFDLSVPTLKQQYIGHDDY